MKFHMSCFNMFFCLLRIFEYRDSQLRILTANMWPSGGFFQNTCWTEGPTRDILEWYYSGPPLVAANG